MTRLLTPIHRSYARQARTYGPWSIPGLVERWPVRDGKLYTDAAASSPAGTDDPVGAWTGVMGALDLVQADSGKRPSIDDVGPAVTFDQVDDLLAATYSLSMASRWAIAMAVWARDDSDAFTVDELDAVTNLAGEYGVRVGVGDNLQATPPANWDPDDWCIAGWVLPDFASGDGLTHFVGAISGDADNYLQIRKTDSGNVLCRVRVGAVNHDATLTLPIVAGAPFFVGARLNGGTLTLYADTNGDGTLETNAVGSVPGFGALSWAANIGASQDSDRHLEGALSLLVTTDGSSADPITDRFNGGDGLALEEWAQLHSDKLVLLVDGAAGAPRFRTAYGSAPSVTRNDTESWVDWRGVVQSASANVLRNRHRMVTNDSVSRRMTLLTRAYTNLVATALSGWGLIGTLNRTASQSDPSGGTGAYLLEDADAGVSAALTRTLSGVSGDGTKSIKLKVKEGTAAAFRIGWYDNTAGTFRHRVKFTWTAGKPVGATLDGAGTVFAPQQEGEWWTVAISVSGVVAVNTNILYVYPCFDTAASETGTLYAWEPEAFNAAVPPPNPLVASEATATDAFTVDLDDATPQEATYLYEGTVLDLPNLGTHRVLFSVGSAANPSAHLACYYHASTARLQIQHHNGTSGATEGYWDVSSLAVDDHITIRLYQAASGAITARLSVNGGAEVAPAGAVGTVPLAGAWANAVVRFAAIDAALLYPCNSGLISFKAQSGPEKSLAAMQALTAPDICVYRSGQVSELATLAASVATKGVPSRVICSASKDGALLPFVYAALATDEKLEIGVRNDAGTRTEASSSGSVSAGVHSLILEFDGTSTLKAYVDTVEVASVAVAGAFTGLDRLNLGGLKQFVDDAHPYDERIGDVWLHAGASFPGYTAIDRKRLHNYLAGRTTGLSEV